MIVVDASVIVNALATPEPYPGLTRRLAEDEDFRAPHLIDIEFASAVRHLASEGELTDDRAADALSDLKELRIVRYPHLPLVDRVWELRRSLTAYDAAYVALAEILAVPFVTCDARLARSHGHQAEIELFAPAQLSE